MPEIKSPDGASLSYEIHGDGPIDLFFLHGLPGSGLIWREVVEYLTPAAAFRCIVLDLRGHGRSEPGAAALNYAQVHADILLVADTVKSASAIWVTHSGSGRNALWLAAHAPARVRGLVLVAPTGCRALPFPRATIGALAGASRDPVQMKELLGQWFRLGSGPGYEAYLRSLENMRSEVMEQTMDMWIYTAVESEARAITQPILAVAGSDDAIYPLEFLRQNLLAQIPHAQVAVPKVGHFIPLETPALLAKLVLDFGASACVVERVDRGI